MELTPVELPPGPLSGPQVLLSNQSYANGAYSIDQSSGNGVQAFDRNSNTSWQSSEGSFDPATGFFAGSSYLSPDYFGEWIALSLPTDLILKSYSVQCGSIPSRAPTAWRLYGSTAPGGTWYQLSEQSDASFGSAFQVRVFPVPESNAPAFSRYGLVVSRTPPGSSFSYFEISELRLFGFLNQLISINYGESFDKTAWEARDVLLFDGSPSSNAFAVLESNLSLNILGDLDRLSVAARSSSRAAYALRRLSASYGGPTVRITNDNKSADLFFSTISQFERGVDQDSNVLATRASLDAWIGSNAPYVSIWYDQSGNGRHATQNARSNQPILEVGGFYALDFRTDRFLNLPDGTLPEGDSDYTLIAHHGAIAGSFSSNYKTLVFGGRSNSTDAGLGFQIFRNAYDNGWINNSFFFGTYSQDNVVTCKYQNGQRFGYVNDVFSAAAAVQGGSNRSSATSSNGRIGAHPFDSNSGLDGDLYGLYVFDKGLDPSDLRIFGRACGAGGTPKVPGLLADSVDFNGFVSQDLDMFLDPISGSYFVRSSNNRLQASALDSTYLSGGAAVTDRSFVWINGSPQYITTGSYVLDTNFLTPFTWEAWFWDDATGLVGANAPHTAIVSNYRNDPLGTVSPFVMLHVTSAGLVCYGERGSGTQSNLSVANVADSRWHHVVLVGSSNQLQLYVDGNADSAIARPGGTTSPPTNHVIIGGFHKQVYQTCRIGRVRSYKNRALSLAEVRQNYNAERRFYAGAAPSAAFSTRLLVGNYKGPLIRVSRSDDNAEADVYFDFKGRATQVVRTDLAASFKGPGALAAFKASSPTLSLTRWYDQSPNENHMYASNVQKPSVEYDPDSGMHFVNTYPVLGTLRPLISATYNNMRTGDGPHTEVATFRLNLVQSSKMIASLGPANAVCDGQSIHSLSIGSGGRFAGGTCGSYGTWTSTAGVVPAVYKFNRMITTNAGRVNGLESVYVDGVLDKSATVGCNNTPISSANRVGLGWVRDDGATLTQVAEVYDLLFYNNVALTRSEASALNAALAKPAYVQPGALDFLLAYSSYSTYSSPPVAAYSTRLLFGNYPGPLLRVRRSNDSAEADVFADSRGNVTKLVVVSTGQPIYGADAVSSFQGSSMAFVNTWYDQSFRSNHAVRTTAANQPTLVTLANNNLAVSFDGAADRRLISLSNVNITGQANFSLIDVHTIKQFKGTSSVFVSFGSNATGAAYHWMERASNGSFVRNGFAGATHTAVSQMLSPQSLFVAASRRTGSNPTDWSIRVDGQDKAFAMERSNEVSSVNLVNGLLYIGGWMDGALEYNSASEHCELLLFSNDIGSNVTRFIESNVMSHYKISSELGPLLDSNSGALDSIGLTAYPLAAYSLNKLFSNYAGPTVRVRRPADNAQTDVYLNKEGYVYGMPGTNTTDLVGWLGGSSNAFLTTWYDQTSNGLHFSMDLSNNQPILTYVSSSKAFVQNGAAGYLRLSSSYLKDNLPNAITYSSRSKSATYSNFAAPFNTGWNGTLSNDGDSLRFPFYRSGSNSYEILYGGSNLTLLYKNNVQVVPPFASHAPIDVPQWKATYNNLSFNSNGVFSLMAMTNNALYVANIEWRTILLWKSLDFVNRSNLAKFFREDINNF